MSKAHTAGPYIASGIFVYGNAPDSGAPLLAKTFGLKSSKDITMREEAEANAILFAAAPELLEIVKRYMAAYPAFRIKPIGAPGSEKRIEQENLMALEDAARAAVAKATGAAQ